jgi:curli production assembly/transport component CsgG|tara:strand:+ start:698 stop:1465 length:768 start_codon:yes stop_codon:yes gene_type:complete
LIALLSNCGIIPTERLENFEIERYPSVNSIINKELLEVKEPEEKLIVAVYPSGFTDQTGQRRSNSTYASFSSAITQAPYNLLIRALNETGMGKFFTVVERVSLENLTKERQIIRSTRKDFEEEQKLRPLLFAGMLFEGGVVAYESNVRSGGNGARLLGVGVSKQYRQDTVTVSLRLVSVLTGRILVETTVTKTILSSGTNGDLFRFVKNNTELIEIESGIVENESVTIALQSAIEFAVLRIIEKGHSKNLWSFKE